MPDEADSARVASELRLVLGQLVRRLRAEHRFPITQGTVLGRLDREGAQSVSDLAAKERVRHQSMTQTVTDLEADGFVQRRPDPGDRRRVLVSLTKAGRRALEEDRRQRVGWLAGAMDERLSERELRVVDEAVELLQRLADG
jgi:DNA-binding MarR family transcriptional regulator